METLWSKKELPISIQLERFVDKELPLPLNSHLLLNILYSMFVHILSRPRRVARAVSGRRRHLPAWLN